MLGKYSDMKTVTLNTQEAPIKWWAARDANMRNIANASLYSDSQKTRAERMKIGLGMVYSAKNIYIAYGKRGISIKIDSALVTDRKNLKLFEQDYESAGIIKKVTPQGVVYRITS